MAELENIREYYLKQYESINRYLSSCLNEINEDQIHRLRLAIKKLQAFNLLGESIGFLDHRKHIRNARKIKKLFNLVGQIRDYQVQIIMLRSIQNETGSDFNEFDEWLTRHEQKKVEKFHSKQRRIYEKSDIFARPENIILFDVTIQDDQVKVCARKVIDSLILSTREQIKILPDTFALHRIRMITKRLRYVINIMQHVYPDFNHGIIPETELRAIENIAGEWHDKLLRDEMLERYLKKRTKEGAPAEEKYLRFLALCSRENEVAFTKTCARVRKVYRIKN